MTCIPDAGRASKFAGPAAAVNIPIPLARRGCPRISTRVAGTIVMDPPDKTIKMCMSLKQLIIFEFVLFSDTRSQFGARHVHTSKHYSMFTYQTSAHK